MLAGNLLLTDRRHLSAATGYGHLESDLVARGYARQQIRIGGEAHRPGRPADRGDSGVIECDRARSGIDCGDRSSGFARFASDGHRRV